RSLNCKGGTTIGLLCTHCEHRCSSIARVPSFRTSCSGHSCANTRGAVRALRPAGGGGFCTVDIHHLPGAGACEPVRLNLDTGAGATILTTDQDPVVEVPTVEGRGFPIMRRMYASHH